jgi:pyruvate kinase
VQPELVPHAENYDQMFARAREVIARTGIAKPGDRVLVTAGVPFDVSGSTNLLKVEVL